MIDVSVYSTEQGIPSFEQVEQVQALINQRIGRPLNVNFQLRVQRIPVTVVSGSEQFDNLRLTTQPEDIEERLKTLEQQLQKLRSIPMNDPSIQPDPRSNKSTAIPSAEGNAKEPTEDFKPNEQHLHGDT